MGTDQEQSLKSAKSEERDFFEEYKEKEIKKQLQKAEDYKDKSGSWIFYNKVLAKVLDIASWAIVIGALYLGWKSGKWEKITCDRISPDFCNSCFLFVKQNATNTINAIGANLTNIPFIK